MLDTVLSKTCKVCDVTHFVSSPGPSVCRVAERSVSLYSLG